MNDADFEESEESQARINATRRGIADGGLPDWIYASPF